MEELNKINTITYSQETKFKEKGSVFVGRAFPVNSKEETENILQSVKKEFYDATHHCYAYKLSGGILKYSDDGEPNGSAGVRILNAIEHFNLTNLVVVVIRYFGGIKLGVGPLGKAYYNSAFITLEKTEIVQKENHLKLKITADFSYISTIHKIISNYNAVLKNSFYNDKCNFEILLKDSLQNKFENEITDISKGTIEIEVLEKNIFI